MAKKKKSENKVLVDVSEVWPQEREFIERPERFKYVRKIIKPEGCVFCTAADSKPSAKSLVLLRKKHCMVVMNKFPYNNGHLLVIPARHVGNITQLKKAEYSELMLTLQQACGILQNAYNTENMNLGMNHGAVAGAGIPDHLHWHIVPRWFGDTNFFPLIAETKIHSQTHEQVFKQLRPLFKKLESK